MSGKIELSDKPWIALRLRRRRLELRLAPTDIDAQGGPSARSVIDIESGARTNSFESTLLAMCGPLGLDFERDLMAPPTVEELAACGVEAVSASDSGGTPNATGHGLAHATDDASRRRRPFLRIVAWTAAVVVAVAIAAYGVVLYRQTFGVVYVRVSTHSVELCRGASGKVIQEWNYGGEVVSAREVTWNGRRRLVYATTTSPDRPGMLFVRELPSGDLAWSDDVDVSELAYVFGPEMADQGRMSCQRFIFGDIDGDGRDEIIAYFEHQKWYPALVRVYRDDGSIVGWYFNRGHVYGMTAADVDGDGKDEILLGATNNGYNGASLIVLDNTHCRGASSDSLVMADCPVPDGSLVRLVWPNWDAEYRGAVGCETGAGARLEARKIDVFKTAARETHIMFTVTCGLPEFGVVVVLDDHFEMVSAEPSDEMRIRAAAHLDSTRADTLLGPYIERWARRPYRYGWTSLRVPAAEVAAFPDSVVAHMPSRAHSIAPAAEDYERHRVSESAPKQAPEQTKRAKRAKPVH